MKGSALLLLLAIADHAHDDGGGAYPSIETLSQKIRMSVRQTQRALRVLEAAGELKVAIKAGPHEANLYTVRNIRSIGGDKMTPRLATVMPSATTGGDIAVSRGGDIAMSPKPSVTTIEPSKVRAAAAGTPPKKVRDEEAAAVREATSLWVAERALHRERSGEAYSRFTDRAALRNLAVAIRRSLAASEWRDILQGIRVGASRPNANPYYADEWAREQAGLRSEAESLTRKMDERDRENGELHRVTRAAPRHISAFLPAS
jgi:hypothetical protein